MSDDFDSDGDGERDGERDGEQAGERERAEAAALAAALDGKPHGQDAPEDALAAALLMRHGGRRGELSAERSEQILSALLHEAAPAGVPLAAESSARADDQTTVPAARKGKLLRSWPIAAGLAAAAAAALTWLGVETLRRGQPTAAAPVTVAAPAAVVPAVAQPLPQASVQLLAAQGALLRAGSLRGSGSETPHVPTEQERTAAARYETELRAYRAELLRALQAQYPSELGLLGPVGVRSDLELERDPARRPR